MKLNNVLFEIGVEELPARFMPNIKKQLHHKTSQFLTDLRLSFETIQVYATPRRLAVFIHDLAEAQTAFEEVVRGPRLDIAKDENGEWTKAAIGFTRSQQLTVDDIFIQEEKGTEYIFVEKVLEKKPAVDLLPQFSEVIDNLSFPQTMRWGELSYRFARPIRWLTALYNDEVIPFVVANVPSDRITYGHRFLGGKIVLDHASDYEEKLEENNVIINDNKREQLIVEQIKQLEKDKQIQVIMDEALIEEVNFLVEYPTVFIGTFDEAHLQLPKEVLITSMKEHQRYFPVVNESKQLLPYFVGVRNGDQHHLENVIRGNEKVLKARLADAEFFYEEDKNQSIEQFNDQLKNIVFQEEIGTVYEKTQAVKAIAVFLADQLQLGKQQKANITRAASIYKFDLVTQMVNEFPELQGVMGSYYATHYGETKEVAQAIREQYLPTHANGELPTSIEGKVLSIADKLDTIVACISVGLIPTGSQDPYALRRQAIGLLRIIVQNEWNISVQTLVEFACEEHGISTDDIRESIESFMKDRGLYILEQAQIHKDIGTAIIQQKLEKMHDAIEKGKILSEKKNDHTFKQKVEAFIRVLNIGNKYEQKTIDENLFETASESELYRMYEEVKQTLSTNNEYTERDVLQQLEKLAEPIHAFFENNMVMDDNEDIKNNRIALLYHISILLRSFADFSLIEWKK